MSEERGEKLAGEQGTVRGTAYQQEMQRRLARLNLGSGAFTDVMRAATTECRLFEGERAQLLESERAAHAGTEKAQREARATLENISDAFVALDRKRRFVYVNRLTGRFWGKPQKELLGNSLLSMFIHRYYKLWFEACA